MKQPQKYGCAVCAVAAALTLSCSAAGSGGPGNGGHHDAGPHVSMDGGTGGPGVDAAHSGMTDGRTPNDVNTDSPIDRMAFCMGAGPAVVVGDDSSATVTCAGTIASRVFSNSVCTCTDANIAGYFRTRSFHSGMGGMEIAAGGPVGIDNHYTTTGYADVGGTFAISGTTGVSFAGYLQVGGDLRSEGPVSAIGYIKVKRDAWVRGNISVLGVVEVDRDVHQPTGNTIGTVPDIRGATVHETFTVDPPCDCSPPALVDINGIIDDGVRHNDNADVGLDPHSLENVIGIGVDITLPCGRFYVTHIGGLGGITIHVPGRTALFVDGDVQTLGALNVDMGPTGELDMFIRGDLLSIGAGKYGSRMRPAATRIYVGGSRDVTIIGADWFVGNVYAPRSRITAPGATTVYGSLFGRLIDIPGYLDVHYDRAILDVGADCPIVPPGGCTMCSDTCGGRACVSGMCASCTSDADCCAPLVCYADGTCGALVI